MHYGRFFFVDVYKVEILDWESKAVLVRIFEQMIFLLHILQIFK